MNNSNTTKTILIADDDQFIVRAFKTGLERYDYSVVIAENGEDAIEQIASVRPDLVLLDVIMPRKDGFEVLKAVKADPALAHIPIIMLTSLGQSSDEQTARDYGANDFLVKSDVSLNDILLRVQHLLEEAEEAAAATATEETAPAVSTVPDINDAEAAAIAESIKTEAQAVDSGNTDPATPESTVPDLTQPIPAEVTVETSETPEQNPESSDAKPKA